MKEMVGGCCVCSDERGWSENPLVYCDGQHCTVAVHQACYGIVTVPTGNWYCRKCESQERSTRVRCELCPSKDGALKRTDNQGWAHVVCALYIPEVRFGNVTTMEPIILQLIPPERFNKVCYICHENSKGSKATAGACMQCNKAGCKQQFHVTCAQARGLLCEEAGNYLDNVKYCGYCQHHYSKLKKGGNVKTIPPYKPVNHGIESSDPSSSPEKESETAALIPIPPMGLTSSNVDQKQSSQNGSHKSVQRKSNVSSGGASSSSISSSSVQQSAPFAVKQSSSQSQSINQNTSQINTSSSSSNLSADLLNVSGGDGGNSNSSNSTKESSSSKSSSKSNSKGNSSSTKSSSKEQREPKHSKPSRNHSKDSAPSEYDLPNTSTPSDGNVTPVSSAANKESMSQKFTTSNFTETVVVASDSVFGNGRSNVPVVKKRKLESIKSSTTDDMIREGIKDVSVTLVPLAYDKGDNNISDTKKVSKPKAKPKCADTDSLQNQHATVNTQQNIVKPSEEPSHHPATSVSLVVSVPLSSGVNLPSNTSTVTIPSHHQIPNIKSFANPDLTPNQHINRSHNLPNVIVQQAADLQVRDQLLLADKQALVPGGAIVRNPSPSQSTGKISSNLGLSSKGKGTGGSSLFSDLSTSNSSSNMETLGVKLSAKTAHLADDVSLSRITSTPDDNSSSFSDLKISFEAQSNYDVASLTPRTDIKNSPPSSPGSEMAEPHKRIHSASNDGSKDIKVFPSSKDMHATHMLGNQLNPSSSVAQKMSDQLFMEMEAHSVYTSSSMDSNTQIMGPVFPGKQLNNARNMVSNQPQGPSLSSMLGGTGQPTAHGNTPQSLEQLLERQWEQGSQFLMEQAQHFDIASLLSCLHQLRSENIRLEEHVNNLIARRDHLLAVNARLTIPLNQVPQVPNQNPGTFNNLHLNGTTEPNSRSRSHHLK
ncbi:protein AF-10-like isoform X2 [Contarinia nasturtii]|uniref:protein AF-10-like isoform X2 n=1 Tax=Contarinia nasturtii TaxID=265458 RepID=UPI0012D39FD8|nr:protein AF-10-like isoform X2 [Contarinia nasturtii]